MSLYKDWSSLVTEFVKKYGEEAFWDKYGAIETSIYSQVLSNHTNIITGNLNELAEKFGTDSVYFMGFMDGINDSLNTPNDLENLTEGSPIALDIDFHKLYFNMIDAKADYLYSLSQWEGIFSNEKRKEIHKEWSNSKIITNKNKIGRNEPCPCGSGKKYKQCCGK
jgi:preprotein translocase subunit SecA